LKLLNEQGSDEKAYCIRNVTRIEKPSEFFELLEKTASKVKFSADGLAINDTICTASEEFNSIFKRAFNFRLKEIARMDQKIRNEEVDKLISDLAKDIQAEQPSKFNKLLLIKQLTLKQVNGIITYEEIEELKTKLEQCSKHQKEYFLRSSNDTQLLYDQSRENFKKQLDTFTNARVEHLFYRINTEEVKKRLIEATGQPNFQDYEVRGQKVFSNMKIIDYDQIDSVLNSMGQRADDILKASIKIANDSSFSVKASSLNHIMFIVEILSYEEVIFFL
jgi:hypothetical protein